MKWPVVLSIATLLLAACGIPAAPPVGANAPLDRQSFSNANPAAAQSAYWTMSEGTYAPQVESAKVPLHEYSQVTNILSVPGNKLLIATGMALDPAGHLWILSYGLNDRNAPVSVFDMPFKQTSTLRHHYLLSGTEGARDIAFDASGNLWVSSRTNSAVFEFKAPFKKNGTLSSARKLTSGIKKPLGLALDAKGNLYVSNWGSFGTHSIAVFKAPIKNAQPYFLNGLYSPGGLLFDKHGNLYGSTNGPSGSAIVRYDSNDLHGGAGPTIYDSTGIYHSFGANFALSASGDLYVSNCGVAASIFVYPTSTKPFSEKLAPSLDFTDYFLYGGCAWGLVIQ